MTFNVIIALTISLFGICRLHLYGMLHLQKTINRCHFQAKKGKTRAKEMANTKKFHRVRLNRVKQKTFKMPLI